MQSAWNVLAKMERLNEKNNYWCVPRKTAKFIYELILQKQCGRILEIGTSIGYSALWMALAARNFSGRVYTVESHKERAKIAENFFQESGLEKNLVLLKGHAPEILMQTEMPTSFDFIFLDATKRETISHFEVFAGFLAKDGIILVDNILSHFETMQPFLKHLEIKKKRYFVLKSFGTGLALIYP